jgi:DNA polymerase IIIc chi subunit
MQNIPNASITPELSPDQFIKTFSQVEHNPSEIYNQQESLKLCFKAFAQTQNSPNFERNLNDFFSKDTNRKIKEALNNEDFLQEVFLEALNFDNFKLINKIITSIDDGKKLKILNDLLEEKILVMTNSETPEMPKSLVLNILEINNNGENILHIIASEANSDKEKLAKYKDIIDERKNADFITHLLHSENKQGKTPLEIARENNNQDFIDIFDGKPYAILSEIKSYQKLIKEKVNHKSCEVM